MVISDEEIVAFEVIPTKLFKSSSNAFINTVVATATKSNLITVYDMNGNILD